MNPTWVRSAATLMALTFFFGLSGDQTGSSAVSASTFSTFFSSESSGTVERQVAENQPAGTAVGAPVTPANPVGAVAYSLGGSDAAGFSIDSASGRLRTTGPLDYETRKRYAVTVTATDDNGS
ncbi:MAG: cadherin repeat domain-containing protein, partial [Acidimicrobiia bacterium]|nr:cadherin repeat domain-containing protein [Acidimicrobiia bacterium]